LAGLLSLLIRRITRITHVVKAERWFIVLRLDNLVTNNVYLPCQSTVNYEDVYAETLANIIQATVNFSDCAFIIAGDFNCNMSINHTMFSTIDEFMTSLDVVNITLSRPNDVKFTFYHGTTGACSLIDHFMISMNSFNAVQSYCTIDTGNNLSDHLPLSMHVSWVPQVNQNNTPTTAQPKATKLRWDKASLNNYRKTTYKLLSEIDIASVYDGIDGIESCYASIVNCLSTAATQTIPHKKVDFYKFWWDDELDHLKMLSIDTHQVWKDAGRPRSGPVFEAKRLTQANYKLAINNKRQLAQEDFTDALSEALLKKDSATFWKTWRVKFGRLKPPKVVAGSCDDAIIVNKFADVFEAASAPTAVTLSTDSDPSFLKLLEEIPQSTPGSNPSCLITVDDITSCINSLKRGKASGFDDLSNEHIIFSHPILTNLLMHLFNAMIYFGYVPDAFGTGVIIPLLKNSESDASNVDNYRGITLSPCISKLFELCILTYLKPYLKTSALQFGFKEDLGCIHALYTVRAVLDYFNKNGSTVTLCALDISKAFDKVEHNVLFAKLTERGVPLPFICVLKCWYRKCNVVVRWGGSLSRPFSIAAGVRQGGVLSPYFFAVYIDSLICVLEHSGHGCVVHGIYLGCIVYADDIFLMSHSLSSMQFMLDICSAEIDKLHLKFNVKKSVALRIGDRFNFDCAPLTLDGHDLLYVQSVKYLGILIKSGRKMTCSFEHVRLKFYSTFNAIYRRSKSSDSELVTVELVRSFCIPLITYGLEALNLRATDELMLDNLLNNCLSKVFNVSHDKVVLHDIRCYLGLPSMRALCMIRCMKFMKKAERIDNIAVKTALHILRTERLAMCNRVSVDIDCSLAEFCCAVTTL